MPSAMQWWMRQKDRGGAVRRLDHVGVPERPAGLQGLRDQLADQRLKRGLVPGGGQGQEVQVIGEVEGGIVLEAGAARGLHDASVKARVGGNEAALQEFGDRVAIGRRAEHDEGVDDHRVGRPVHMEPGRVGGRHRLAIHTSKLGEAGRSGIRDSYGFACRVSL